MDGKSGTCNIYREAPEVHVSCELKTPPMQYSVYLFMYAGRQTLSVRALEVHPKEIKSCRLSIEIRLHMIDPKDQV